MGTLVVQSSQVLGVEFMRSGVGGLLGGKIVGCLELAVGVYIYITSVLLG